MRCSSGTQNSSSWRDCMYTEDTAQQAEFRPIAQPAQVILRVASSCHLVRSTAWEGWLLRPPVECTVIISITFSLVTTNYFVDPVRVGVNHIWRVILRSVMIKWLDGRSEQMFPTRWAKKPPSGPTLLPRLSIVWLPKWHVTIVLYGLAENIWHMAVHILKQRPLLFAAGTGDDLNWRFKTLYCLQGLFYTTLNSSQAIKK